MGSEQGENDKDKKEGKPNIGFQFNAPVTANTSTFINGNVDNLNINAGLSVDDLKRLDEVFQPFKVEVKEVTPLEKQNQVEKKVQDLHDELSKGNDNVNADRLNKIIDGLMEMVPSALSAVISMFANPVLGALIGPATKLVLNHIQK